MVIFLPEKFSTAQVSGLVVLGLLSIACILRLHANTTLHPLQRDEYAWLLAGQSLLETGRPTAWTLHWPNYDWTVYEKVSIKELSGKVYELVTPWLDHPPLFAVMVGAWAAMVNVGNIAQPNWYLLRLPMVGIAIITMYLTYRLARRLLDSQTAIYVLVAFTFFPAAIVSAPFLLADNMLALWLAASLLLLVGVLESGSSHAGKARALLVLMVLSPLLKLSGAFVGVASSMVLMQKKRYVQAGIVVGATALGILIFAGYGYMQNWDIFLATQTGHHIRPQSAAGYWAMFSHLALGDTQFFDPSIITGLIMVLWLLMQKENPTARLLLGSALFAGTLALLWIAPRAAYSWYKFPLYPLIAIGQGALLRKFVDGSSPTNLLVLPLFVWALEKAFVTTPTQYRLVTLVSAGACFILFSNILHPRLHRSVAIAVVCVLCIAQAILAWKVVG